MHPKITVLIAAAGQPELLRRTLRSLAQCAKPAGFQHTLIVENGPKCGIEQVAKSCPREESVRYLYVPEANKSHALNVALTKLDDELIFFTDDDVQLDPQTLMAYAEGAAGVTSGEFYGGPLIAEYEGDPPAEWMLKLLPKTARGWTMEVDTKTRITDRTFLGPNWAAFASDLRDIGGFETRIGPGGATGSTGQETDAQRRLFAHGVKAFYLPNALAWHFVRNKCLTRQWIVERAYRHGLEWGIRRGRDPKFSRARVMLSWIWAYRRRLSSALLRRMGSDRRKLIAEYFESRWRGRCDGIAISRRWDTIPRPAAIAELAQPRRAA